VQGLILAFLILGPIAFGLAAYFTRGLLRNSLIVAAAVVTAVFGLLLPFQGIFNYSLPVFFAGPAFLLELALISLFIYIGVNRRNWLVASLAGVQLVLALVEKFYPRHGEEQAATFVIDPLSIILVLIISVIGSLILIYAIGYMAKHAEHSPKTAAPLGQFFFFLIAFLGFMNGLVLANDFRWLAIFWEATTLCSFMLIGTDGTEEAKQSATRAININIFGGTALALAPVIALYQGGGESLTGIMGSGLLIPMALICLASFTKSAQLPFQSWLLGAMVAPTPVSALLHSSTMVKAGSYIILRIAPAMIGTPLANIIAIIGALTFVGASALAIGQSNGKKVLAYSTIANLGLIVACAGINTPLAFAAAIMILCYHAISKALLFLCVGTIEQTIGSRDIEDMSGIMFKMPVTTTIAIIGMISMLALPFGLLISKWMAIEAAVRYPLVLFLIIIGSALTIFFWAKWIGRIVTASYHEEYKIEKIPFSMMGTMLTLVTGVIVLGLSAVPLYQLFVRPVAMAAYQHVTTVAAAWRVMQSVDKFMEAPLFISLFVVLVAILLAMRSIKESHIRQPFLCGENAEKEVTSFEFRSLADKRETAYLSSYYMSPVFGEDKLTGWFNPVAIALILIMFGALMI